MLIRRTMEAPLGVVILLYCLLVAPFVSAERHPLYFLGTPISTTAFLTTFTSSSSRSHISPLPSSLSLSQATATEAAFALTTLTITQYTLIAIPTSTMAIHPDANLDNHPPIHDPHPHSLGLDAIIIPLVMFGAFLVFMCFVFYRWISKKRDRRDIVDEEEASDDSESNSIISMHQALTEGQDEWQDQWSPPPAYMVHPQPQRPARVYDPILTNSGLEIAQSMTTSVSDIGLQPHIQRANSLGNESQWTDCNATDPASVLDVPSSSRRLLPFGTTSSSMANKRYSTPINGFVAHQIRRFNQKHTRVALRPISSEPSLRPEIHSSKEEN